MPEPEDLYEDDSSVFSAGMESIDFKRQSLPTPFQRYLTADLLKKSYVPPYWFKCSPQGYYAADVKCQMGPNCIALVFDEDDYLFGITNAHPNVIILVPSDAGMYLRPVTRELHYHQSESSLSWVTFKSSPKIKATIMEEPADPIGNSKTVSVSVSVEATDIQDAAFHYRETIDPKDLKAFTKSLECLNAVGIKAAMFLPNGFHHEIRSMRKLEGSYGHARLCLFYHEIAIRNHEPL